MTHRSLWEHSPDVAFVDDGHRVVMLALSNLRAEGPQILTDTAAAIWRAADGADEAAIVATVAAEYDLKISDIDVQVRQFLSELATQSLIQKSAKLSV